MSPVELYKRPYFMSLLLLSLFGRFMGRVLFHLSVNITFQSYVNVFFPWLILGTIFSL